MFVRQNQQQFRTAGADVQIFYGSVSSGIKSTNTWNKQIGVSNVYMLLIGGGGNGDGVTGGGSGAVTVWYGAAQNVPDTLYVSAQRFGIGGIHSYIWAANTQTPTNSNFLLRAQAASGLTGAGAETANKFTASGFFQSVEGQSGTTGSQSSSTTTFLSGGSASGPISSNYDYGITAPSNDGVFQLQPIIVGVAGLNTNNGGIGCGGGSNGLGGQGMVLIASW